MQSAVLAHIVASFLCFVEQELELGKCRSNTVGNAVQGQAASSQQWNSQKIKKIKSDGRGSYESNQLTVWTNVLGERSGSGREVSSQNRCVLKMT